MMYKKLTLITVFILFVALLDISFVLWLYHDWRNISDGNYGHLQLKSGGFVSSQGGGSLQIKNGEELHKRLFIFMDNFRYHKGNWQRQISW